MFSVTLLQGDFPETKISVQLYHFSYKNTTETCNTAMEREFCRLFGDIFKNCEKLSYGAEFAFFWQVADFACADLKSNFKN